MIIRFVILLLAIPTGYLIAWLCKDELRQGRKYFRIILISSFVFAGLSFIMGKYLMVYMFIFVSIVSFISYLKGKR